MTNEKDDFATSKHNLTTIKTENLSLYLNGYLFTNIN